MRPPGPLPRIRVKSILCSCARRRARGSTWTAAPDAPGAGAGDAARRNQLAYVGVGDWPEFHAQWPLRAHHTQITLNRLRSRNVRTLAGQVAARTALSKETIAAVVERTGGVPLFVEELTRAVLESGNAH
jgi:hypothetical protein